MAELLSSTVATTRELERRLDVAGGCDETGAGSGCDADPTAMIRASCMSFLRKARIHSVAVLRANESNNLHSLAVQMRPVLECAGQVVFQFQTLIIAPDMLMPPERAVEILGDRVNADHFHTVRRVAQGRVSAEELREIEAQAQEEAAHAAGAPKPKRRDERRFTQADKVDVVEGGRQWYGFLSDYFSHASAADWRGPSWRGGVVSMDRVEDEFAFLGLMYYLVQQVALMNSAAALCPVEGDNSRCWEDWVAPALAELAHVRESSKALVDTAKAAMTGLPDGEARID